MSKLNDLLYGCNDNTAFLDDLRRGKFDPEKGEQVKAAIQEFVDKIAESNLEEKWEVGNLCEIFSYVSDTMRQNDYEHFTDYDLEAFDNDIRGIISKLYPEEK